MLVQITDRDLKSRDLQYPGLSLCSAVGAEKEPGGMETSYNFFAERPEAIAVLGRAFGS